MTLAQKDTLTLQEVCVPGYERVYRVEDPSVGLLGIICLHSLKLGPALGGVRIYPYADFSAALTDVTRLAEAMTYKAALAECGLGGGKSVIMASMEQKTEDLLLAFARAIDRLGGDYIGAEDVGSSPSDILTMSRATKYVTGLPHAKSSGNPSSFTAWGTYRGIQAALQKQYGSSSVAGKRVVIQGVGSVGAFLADMLFWNGAQLILTDRDEDRAQGLAKRYGATYVPCQEIFSVPCDVFAPCALGGVLNPNTIPLLTCKVVAGAANNQLLSEQDGVLLKERGILYAPDFVINAGGLMNVADEIMPDGYNPYRVREKIDRIYDKLQILFDMAEKEGISTHEAAKRLAHEILSHETGKRVELPCFHHAT